MTNTLLPLIRLELPGFLAMEEFLVRWLGLGVGLGVGVGSVPNIVQYGIATP